MIERITGKIVEKRPTFCVIDCHGIGIGLHISLNTSQRLDPGSGGQAQLYTYLHVREDILQLYGFADKAEKGLFELLISISGIGPKLAIAVLSGSTTAELQAAIAREDLAMLTRIPGVGRKTAQRLILELKEKIQKQAEIEQLVPAAVLPQQQDKMNEAVLALISLGYKQAEAQRAMNKVVRQGSEDQTVEELVIQALKEM